MCQRNSCIEHGEQKMWPTLLCGRRSNSSDHHTGTFVSGIDHTGVVSAPRSFPPMIKALLLTARAARFRCILSPSEDTDAGASGSFIGLSTSPFVSKVESILIRVFPWLVLDCVRVSIRRESSSMLCSISSHWRVYMWRKVTEE